MAFAKTSLSRSGGVSGTLTCYIQQDTGHASGVHTAGLSGPGGALTYEMRTYEYDYSPNPPPPWPDFELRMYATAVASGGGGASAEETLTGLWVYNNLPPPDTGYEWTGNASEDYAGVTSLNALNLYKAVDRTALLPEYDNGPDDATHPNHGATYYGWGCTDGDTFNTSADSGVTGASDSDTGNTLTPTAGTWDYPSMSIALGVSTTPGYDVAGLIAEWSGVMYLGAVVDFSGIDTTVNGLRILGGNGTLKLYVIDRSLVPVGGHSFSYTKYADITVPFDLQGFSWRDAYAMLFSIPSPDLGGVYDYAYDPYGTGEYVVTSPFIATITYEANSWDATKQRPRPIICSVYSVWAEENNENVTPPDLVCTIEESDLTCDPDNTFAGWRIKRTASLSVQLPADAPSGLPSAWTGAAGVTVAQGAKTSTLTVAAGSTNGSVNRALEEDYFSNYIDTYPGTWIATYGLQPSYQWTKHQPGSDVWCWENYKYLKLTYTATADQELTLMLNYRVVTITDDHMTGSERVTNFSAGTVPLTASWTFTATAGTNAYVVIDLTYPDSPWLRHVDEITISGFANATGYDTTFDLEDIELVRFNPTLLTFAGHTRHKIAFPRVDAASGLPVSYVGFTAVTEGERCLRIPDGALNLSGERGLDFCDYLRGRATGTILDHMWTLPNWADTLARQEGWEVENIDSDPRPWDPPDGYDVGAAYAAAYVDAADKDMLGGIRVGDCAESFFGDELLAIGEAYDDVPIRPRVAALYPPSGTPIECRVRKHLDGNRLALARDGADERIGTGIAANLLECGTTFADDTATDDWSLVEFSGGARENIGGAIAVSGGSPTACGDLYNEVALWEDAAGGTLLWDPFLTIDPAGIKWRVAVAAEPLTQGVVHCHSMDAQDGAPWVATTTRPFGADALYERPSVAVYDDGAILVAATNVTVGNMVLSLSRDRGVTWEVQTLADLGTGLEYGVIWQTYGTTHICGWSADEVLFAESSNTALNRDDILAGITTLVVCAAVVGAYDETPRSGGVRDHDGSHLVCVGTTGGSMVTYRLRSAASGFAVV